MKQTPQEIKIQSMMEPGALTLSGFLGTDDRHYHAIIEEDENTLTELKRTAEEIAERMQQLMSFVVDTFEQPVIVEDHYQVEFETVRGKLICPFGHPGAYPKGIVVITNLTNHVTAKWTPLNVHFIGSHHFFEGKGATFRLDPETLVKAIFE
jgi:hypothetical protein